MALTYAPFDLAWPDLSIHQTKAQWSAIVLQEMPPLEARFCMISVPQSAAG